MKNEERRTENGDPRTLPMRPLPSRSNEYLQETGEAAHLADLAERRLTERRIRTEPVRIVEQIDDLEADHHGLAATDALRLLNAQIRVLLRGRPGARRGAGAVGSVRPVAA